MSQTTPSPPPRNLQIEEPLPLPTIQFETQLKGFTDMFTDRLYTAAMIEAVEMQSKHSPVYMYLNYYEGQYSLLDVYTGKSQEPTPALRKVSNWFKRKILGRTPEPPKYLGVCSGDMLPLLFKYPNLKVKTGMKDYQMSKDLVKLWVQFASDDNPMTFRNSTWLPVTSKPGILQVMKFGNTEKETGLVYMPESWVRRIKFWQSLKYFAPFDQ